MNCTEWAEMKIFTNKNGIDFGLVELKKIPDPKNLFVTLDGKRIYPCSYTELGYPLFPIEIYERYLWLVKARDLKKADSSKVIHVEYFTLPYYPKNDEINTIKSIGGKIKEIELLRKLITDRKIYGAEYGTFTLDEFIIWGKYRLNPNGNVEELVGAYDTKRLGDVCIAHDFYDYVKMRYGVELTEWKKVLIPEKTDMCPWCTKYFNIDYVKNGMLDVINGKVAHHECAEEYKKIKT